MLRPAQIGEMFDRALKEDRDGAVYALYPGLPVVEIPYTQDTFLRLYLGVSAVLSKIGLSSEHSLVRPLHIGVAAGAGAIAVLWLIQTVLCQMIF